LSTISSNRTVLIVEDDESVREYLRILLEQAGYSVIAVDNGGTALAFLRRVRADVIVLDLMLPVLDGWTVAATMQRDPQLARIPIIVFTAAGGSAPPGVAATLVKPSTPDDLFATIERVLAPNRRRSPRYAARFELQATSAERSIQSTTHDLSSGGLSFDAAVAPRIGERIRLIVDLAVHGVTAIDAEVRYVARARTGWRVGTQLLSFHSNAVGFDAQVAQLAHSTAH
jgi:CheY-like chemotaxis protein